MQNATRSVASNNPLQRSHRTFDVRGLLSSHILAGDTCTLIYDANGNRQSLTENGTALNYSGEVTHQYFTEYIRYRLFDFCKKHGCEVLDKVVAQS